MSNTDAQLGADGTPFLRLPIRNRPGRWALIDQADHERLAQGRRSLSLFVSTNAAGMEYLVCDVGGTNRTVARAILNPGRKFTVSYRSKDRCDVRRANIKLDTRRPGGKRKAAQTVAIARQA